MKTKSQKQRRRGSMAAEPLNFTALCLVLASPNPGHVAVVRRRNRVTHHSVVRRMWEGVME